MYALVYFWLHSEAAELMGSTAHVLVAESYHMSRFAVDTPGL